MYGVPAHFRFNLADGDEIQQINNFKYLSVGRGIRVTARSRPRMPLHKPVIAHEDALSLFQSSSHSVQQPGGQRASLSGHRRMVPLDRMEATGAEGDLSPACNPVQ